MTAIENSRLVSLIALPLKNRIYRSPYPKLSFFADSWHRYIQKKTAVPSFAVIV